MAKNYILFDIKEHIFFRMSGNQKTKEKIFGSSGGVIYLNKEGSISLLTYKPNGKLCFSRANLELHLLVLCADWLSERTVKLVDISVVFP